MYSLFWQIYILILYPSSENFTIDTTYHIMLSIVVWHINVSSFCISLQIHSARTMRSESSSLLHFNIRQINEDGSEDATSLGRRQHCWEVFQVGAILFYFWPQASVLVWENLVYVRLREWYIRMLHHWVEGNTAGKCSRLVTFFFDRGLRLCGPGTHQLARLKYHFSITPGPCVSLLLVLGISCFIQIRVSDSNLFRLC